jgi:hypothetical protein
MSQPGISKRGGIKRITTVDQSEKIRLGMGSL